MHRVILPLLILFSVACSDRDSSTGEAPTVHGAPFGGKSFADRCEDDSEGNSAASNSTLFAVNGANEPPFRAVAMLSLSNGFMCSAVLVAPNRLLTAAHCFEKGAKVLTAGFKDLAGKEGEVVKVENVVLHPEYAAALKRGELLETTPSLASFDMAIVLLIEAVKNRQPVQLSINDRLPPGKLVSLVGYGDIGHGAGTKRFAQSHVGSRISETTVGDYHFQSLLLLDSASGTGACPGDSGGGVFAKDAKGYTLLGIVSGINDLLYPGFPVRTCDRCPRGLGIVTLASGCRDFIAAQGIAPGP